MPIAEISLPWAAVAPSHGGIAAAAPSKVNGALGERSKCQSGAASKLFVRFTRSKRQSGGLDKEQLLGN